MPRDVTYLEAARIVLKQSDRPMTVSEIVREIQKRQIIEFTSLTPARSMNARLSVDIRRNGDASGFKRTGRGLYTLRNRPVDENIGQPHQKRIAQSTKVLVFPSSKLDSLGHFHGIRKDYERYANVLLSPEDSFLMSRLTAEEDSNYKQIVSYVMVKYKDSLLRFTRGVVSSVGQYLRGQYSIGFGGHVEDRDWPRDWPIFGYPDAGYNNSVIRELVEEIGTSPLDFSPHNFRLVGVLNDDSTELGRRHFAFIHLLELPSPKFKKGEKSINRLQFIEIPRLADEFEQYEYWSKLCIQTYFGERLAIDCHIHVKPSFSLHDKSDVILIVGYIGCGKTEACSLLEQEFGYKLVPCSKILQQLIGCGSIEQIGRRGLQDLGYNFINESDGHEKLAQAIAAYMMTNPGRRFVLDGLRYPETLQALSNLIRSPITVIFVEPPVDNQFRYYQAREQEQSSFSEFLTIMNHPVERQIERFWPQADITIYNHGSYESYINTLRNYFQQHLR